MGVSGHVTDGVDAEMNDDELAGLDAVVHPGAGEPGGEQLCPGDMPELARDDSRYRLTLEGSISRSYVTSLRRPGFHPPGQ